MPFLPIQLNPGISRQSTGYANETNWYDADKVRFRDGYPEIIGGWTSVDLAGEIQGVGRTLHTWRANSGEAYQAIGTHIGLWVIFAGTAHDITPVRDDRQAVSNPLSITSGSNVLSVSALAHGMQIGSRVELQDFDLTGAGISLSELNRTHSVTATPDVDTFEVTLNETATATVSNGGGTGNILILIEPGSVDTIFGTGYGAGAYSSGGFGEPSDEEVQGLRARVWSLDNFGEILVGTYTGGTPASWDPFNDGVTVRARVIQNAPPGDLLLVTTPDRHLVLFSAELPGQTGVNALAVRWASQETLTEWDPTATNTAGSQLLGRGSQIEAARQSSRQVLIWTDTALTAMQFIGPPFIFGFTPLEGALDIASRNATTEANGTVMWIGFGSFYIFDGISRPLPCSVKDRVFESLNITQRDKTFAVPIKEFQEVWWFYPSANSLEVDRYVLFNYETNTWSYGTMVRTAMEDAGINESVTGISPDGTYYLHEQGYSDDGSPLAAHVESAPFDLSEGDEFMHVRGIIPDARMVGTGNMEIDLQGRRYPQGPQKAYGPYTIEVDTSRVRTRLRVRQIVFRYQSNTTDLFWQGGKPRLELQPRGRY